MSEKECDMTDNDELKRLEQKAVDAMRAYLEQAGYGEPINDGEAFRQACLVLHLAMLVTEGKVLAVHDAAVLYLAEGMARSGLLEDGDGDARTVH